MDRDRRAAYLILKDIEDNDSWSNLSVAKQFSEENPASPAFVRELVYGVLRNQLLLDYNIDSFLDKPKIKIGARILLRMGFYQLSMMDVKDHAAINETVALAKSFMKGSEGFINAVLRNFQRSGGSLKKLENAQNEHDIIKQFSVNYSCDESIVRLLLGSYGKEQAEEILGELIKEAPLSIRVNTLKTSSDELITLLDKESLQDANEKGFQITKAQEDPDVLYVKGTGLLDTKAYEDGLFFVQGEASSLSARRLAAKKGESIADLCAAPGGKTMAMAMLMEGEGKLYAFDLYEHRISLIKKQAKRLGITNIITKTFDSTQTLEDFKVDAVLCDVPCSGLGTARRNPEIKLKAFNDSELLGIQEKILQNAGLYAKDRIVYSTCTINKRENEDQVRNFVQNNPSWKLDFEKQFLPKENAQDGFYIALLRKND